MHSCIYVCVLDNMLDTSRIKHHVIPSYMPFRMSDNMPDSMSDRMSELWQMENQNRYAR